MPFEARVVINRAARILRDREPAVRWITEADPYDDDPGMTRHVVQQERTVSLIWTEDAETAAAVEEWIAVNYRHLCEAERLWCMNPPGDLDTR